MTKSITLNYALVALAAAALMFATATPAFAAINSSRIVVDTVNRGTINNTTEAISNTGGNYAEGSFGGDGDNGGDVDGGTGNNNNGGASAGNGGNGGDAGAGGLVSTGDADATAATENGLNGTDVDMDLTVAGANDLNSTDVRVRTDNSDPANVINNTTRGAARTGDNYAEGSFGGDGDNGGDVNGNTGDFNNGGASAGDGGDAGDGAVGGTIQTGRASSTAGTINLLNTALVRLRI